MSIDDDAFHRQRIVQNWKQDEIEAQRVAVIGAGALGNEVLKLLLQLGVRELALVDFDTVVPANLNRCVFFSQQDVNKAKAEVMAQKAALQFPNSTVRPFTCKAEELPEEFWTTRDYVFSCLDSIGARLHVNAQCYGKATLIDGGTTAFQGKVQVVAAPSACLECGLSKTDYERLWQRYNCVGEQLDWLDPKSPAIGTTTSIVAAAQVNEFVKLVHCRPALVGKYWFWNGLEARAGVFEAPKRADCPAHSVE